MTGTVAEGARNAVTASAARLRARATSSSAAGSGHWAVIERSASRLTASGAGSMKPSPQGSTSSRRRNSARKRDMGRLLPAPPAKWLEARRTSWRARVIAT